MFNFTDNDYRILKSIIDRHDDKKGLCKGSGTTIGEIIEKTQLSDAKVRRTVKRFIKSEFVTEGAGMLNAKTYILTPKGFQELVNLRKNIFGEG
jgi:DNA-binding MarR family transcriptional regulator